MNSNRYPVKVEGKKWGYINGKGEIVIAPQYYFANAFREGLALVCVERTGNEWSFMPYIDKFIDPDGNVIIDGDDTKDYEANWLHKEVRRSAKLEFHYRDFSEGLAELNAGHAFGPRCYVNRSGEVVIPPTLESTSKFSEGIAAVEICIDRRTTVSKFINRKGEVALEPEVEGMGRLGFSEGLCSFRGPIGETYIDPITGLTLPVEKVGFIDRDGKLVVGLEYDYTEDFQNGLAVVTKKEEGSFTRYYINKDGSRYFEYPFDQASNFTDSGIAYVVREGKPQLIDMRGAVINELKLDPEKNGVSDFKEGLAVVVKSMLSFEERVKGEIEDNSKRMGYMDTRGEIVIPLVFTCAEDFECGLARVQHENGDAGYIDREGKFVWKTRGWDISSWP